MSSIIMFARLLSVRGGVAPPLAALRLLGTSAPMQLKKVERVFDPTTKTIVIEGKYVDADASTTAAAGNRNNNVLRFDCLDDNDDEAAANECESEKPTTLSIHHKYNEHETDFKRPCAFCELEKRNIFVQYTDLAVLRQFVRDDAKPLGRKITGLCRRQHRKLVVLIKHAMYAGLILDLQPRRLDGSKPDPRPETRPEYLKYNSYFDTYEKLLRTRKFL